MPAYSWSDPVILAFVVIPVLLVLQLAAAVSYASRRLDEPDAARRSARIGTLVIAFTPYGTRLVFGLPLGTLIAIQGFRLPLELAMHGMYDRGIMPVQMSYSGRNFDIIRASPRSWSPGSSPPGDADGASRVPGTSSGSRCFSTLSASRSCRRRDFSCSGPIGSIRG